MTKRPCNAVAHVKLLTSGEGGRSAPTPADQFGCIMQIDGVNLSVRLWLDETGPLHPGQEERVRLGFLDPDFAADHCSAGQGFVVWDGRVIGRGTILETAFPARDTGPVARTA